MATALSLGNLIVNPEQTLAVSDWIEISQARIDAFADITGDSQWIHTDPVRAAASPFGATIAHGFLTLSLVSRMKATALTVAGTTMAVNYGLNKVRFVAPVPAGSRVRGLFAVAALEPFDGGVQVSWHVTIERDGTARPCCVAEWLVRYYR